MSSLPPVTTDTNKNSSLDTNEGENAAIAHVCLVSVHKPSGAELSCHSRRVVSDRRVRVVVGGRAKGDILQEQAQEKDGGGISRSSSAACRGFIYNPARAFVARTCGLKQTQ